MDVWEAARNIERNVGRLIDEAPTELLQDPDFLTLAAQWADPDPRDRWQRCLDEAASARVGV